jgi:hypothetical protein
VLLEYSFVNDSVKQYVMVMSICSKLTLQVRRGFT